MAPAVTVDEDAKSRLEELQAQIRLRTGESLTLQELLSRLIDDAFESRAGLVNPVRESAVPLSEAETEAMARSRISSGVQTDEDDVDENLYR